MAQQGYTIAGGEAGKHRLNLQHGAYGPDTVRLLRDCGVRPGMQCLDLGSGAGDTTFEIARLVGPHGRVIGVDCDAEIVGLARIEAQQRGFANVVFEVDDVRGYRGPRVDFVFARLLLSHLPEPARMIATMMSYVRPGGIVAVEDLDITAAFGEPSTDVFHRGIDLYAETVRQGGGNATLARELALLADAAGLRGVHCRFHQPAYVTGPLKRLGVLAIEGMRDAIVSHGVAGADELEALIAEIHEFVARADTLFALPRIAQVWGTV